MVACEERATKAEADARIERDWRCSLQEKETKHKELISSLQIEIKKLTDDIRVSIFNYVLNELKQLLLTKCLIRRNTKEPVKT